MHAEKMHDLWSLFMLPLKFLLTHYNAAERLLKIQTLLAEDPDLKWKRIFTQGRMLPFILSSIKMHFKNAFKIKLLLLQNFEP